MQQLTIEQALSQAKKAVKKGNTAVALQLFNAVLQHQPNHPVAKKGLRKLQKALSHNHAVQVEAAIPSQDQLNVLVNLYNSGQMIETEQACRNLLQAYPQSLVAINVLGAALKGQGKLLEAVASYEKAIQLKPDYAEAYLNRGAALQELGQPDKAVASYEKAIQFKPDYADAYLNRGAALQELGQPDEAVASYEKAIQLKPGFAMAYSNRGAALQELGQQDEAVASYEKAIQLKPDYAEAYFNRGNVLKDLGQLDEAVTNYNKAIHLKPDYTTAYSNRGAALMELGQLDEAVGSLDKAIQFKPDFAEAYFNRGAALQESGRLDEALASYEKAIQLKPDYADAYSNRGAALQELGQLDTAITSYQKAVSIEPQNGLFWSGFSDVLETARFTSCSDDLTHYLLQILEQSTVRPGQVSGAVISALQHHPIVSRILKLVKSGHIDEDIGDLTEQLSTVPLLLRVMELSPIADLDVEKMLTEMRKAMLHKAAHEAGEAQGLAFYTALAMHCFTNEYVFSESEAERQELELLEERVKESLAREPAVLPTQIVVLGTYRPLSSYSWADDLLQTDWSTSIRKVIVAQIENVREEQVLRSKIPCLSSIEDKVSQLVRSQYEENPYPRWINAGVSDKPRSIWQILRSKKFYLNFAAQQLSDKPDILVAGCGTGQHAIRTASRFLNCNVLAVDLSLSSLAYATRKTRELGIANIEYMQGDILNLNQLEREFDIVESVGVLHHMDDPLAGWKALVGSLRTGGFMKIGLYSEIARQDIVEAREEIALKEYTSTPDNIRRYREEVINMDVNSGSQFLKVLGTPDFFSLSTCRDLLFHIQEHRFTLPQIEGALSELGLTFLGFEFKKSRVRSEFSKYYPGEDALVSLPLWHRFEQVNPNIFRGMYQFWVQKA